ncbi:hypothetical protein DITRI_Ditri05aG0091300 [Diplodiscus trichospermus]
MSRLKLRLKVKFLQLNLQRGLAMFRMILTLLRDKRHQKSQKPYATNVEKHIWHPL